MQDAWRGFCARNRRDLARIGDPINGYIGRRSPGFELPDNILIFQRLALTPDMRPNRHHRFVLIVALAGSAGVRIDGNIHRLVPGRALLIFPHQLHSYSAPGGAVRWLFITFEGSGNHPWKAMLGQIAVLGQEQRRSLEMLIHAWVGEVPAARLALLLALLLDHLRTRLVTSRVAGSEMQRVRSADILERVNLVLRDGSDAAMGVARMAERMGVSASHLRRVIRRSLGIGLGQYMLRVRINHARALLGDPRLSVADVARRCGFGSSQSFSRAYRRTTGRTPGSSRR